MGWYHYQAAEDGTPGEKIECPDGTCAMKEKSAPSKETNISIAEQQNEEEEEEEEEEELYEASGTIYHLCQKSLWLDAVEKGKPYFPPTFMKDGKFTRFSCERDTLVDTANHYYGSFPGDWLCLSLNATDVRNRGVPIVAQRAPESTKQEPIQCLKVYSGIGVGQAVLEIHRMRRDEQGKFLGMIVDTVTPKLIMDRNALSKAVKQSSSKAPSDSPQEQPLPKKETKVGGFFTMKKLRK
jgi:hypothetical protein